MGRLADRFGVMVPVLIGAVGLGLGFIAARRWPAASGCSRSRTACCIGLLGSSATFAPLVADTSLWFVRRRGIAVAICASGNYLAGAVWPPIMQHFVETVGWRATYIGIGVFCVRDACCRSRWLLRRAPAGWRRPRRAQRRSAGAPSERPFGLSPAALQVLLCVAGVACCVAMSMPQVHIVAYCGDLGYGAARGAADAVADARLAASSAGSSRAGSATASAACARCCSARCCRAWRCCCSCPSTAWCRCT